MKKIGEQTQKHTTTKYLKNKIMKNIHVLTTEKFSNLILQTNGELRLSELELRGQVGNGFTQNIYITSDEEIKEGDWYIFPLYKKGFTIKRYNSVEHFSKEPCISLANLKSKKIILTTDQDLIKDGVQAIDDEFLEWFVKNPSCEWVDVWLMNKGYNKQEDYPYQEHYLIIIPKEEPFKHKVEVLSKEEILANRSNAYEFIDFDKQETLEELKKWKEEALIAHEINQKVIAKHERAEWKLQQLYSEEKIDKILQKLEEIKIMINIR